MKFWQKKKRMQKQQNKNEQAAAEMGTFLPWLIFVFGDKCFLPRKCDFKGFLCPERIDLV